LTSSSPSRAEDSFCKTAMSRREDIVSCIDVTMMDRFAHSALPSPYSKTLPAFRAGAAVTHAAGLGGKRFVDLCKPHACVSAFIQQDGSERAPSGGVNRSGSPSMAGALCAGQEGFQVAVKARRLDRWQSLITERGKSLQPQIDAQARDRAIENRSDGRFISLISRSLRHTDIQIPAPAAVPQRQPTSRKIDLPPSIANRSDLEGNPAQRPACTATLAPGQSDFSMLSAPPRVFFSDLLHRLDRQMQGTLTVHDPCEERPEIESRQKPPLALEHFDRQIVAIIEHRVDLAPHAAKPCRVLVLHPQAQEPNSGRSRAGHPYSMPKNYPVISRQTSRNAGRGRQVRRRVSPSLAGLRAGVSRGEIT
jgi:hypothetical protein